MIYQITKIRNTATEDDYQNGVVRRWFTMNVDGEPMDFGKADHSDGRVQILDADGCPMTDGDGLTEAVRRAINMPSWPAGYCRR